MASTKAYLEYILEQLSELGDVAYRPMMGEYILYIHGKIVGGIYDDWLLIKPVTAAISYLTRPVYELPYAGAKEMLLIEDVDDRAFLHGLFSAMLPELPAQKAAKARHAAQPAE